MTCVVCELGTMGCLRQNSWGSGSDAGVAWMLLRMLLLPRLGVKEGGGRSSAIGMCRKGEEVGLRDSLWQGDGFLEYI